MLSHFERLDLSTAARCLGLVLALKMRETFDGSWVVWRGRESLARLTGLSTKTVTKARRELVRHHLIFERHGGSVITAKNGQRHRTARGVMIIEIVRDPEAAARAEIASKLRMDSEVESITHFDRVQIQKRLLIGEIDKPEYEALTGQIRAQARRQLSLQRGNRVPPSNSATTSNLDVRSADHDAKSSPLTTQTFVSDEDTVPLIGEDRSPK